MKYVIRIILCLCVLFPQIGFAEELDEETLSQIVEAISIRLNFKLYWGFTWVLEQQRELRFIRLSEETYLAALELLNGDWTKLEEADHYQILLVRVDGVSPVVYFPGLPYTLQDLEEASKREGQLFDKITADHVRQIQEKGMYVETRFVLHKQDRIYHHGEAWRLRIEQLEERLIEHIEFCKYTDGVIIIHDLIESDEYIDGMMFANKGSKIIGLIGVIHKREPGGMYEYYCDIQETTPSMNHVDAEWLSLLLRKPLIWRFTLNEEERCILERITSW